MTEPEADYGERLRRALHAAADTVVPSGDGLERIRRRTARTPAQDGLGWLAAWLRFAVLDRFAPPGGWRTPAFVEGWRQRLPRAFSQLALVDRLRPLWLWLWLSHGWQRLAGADALRRLRPPDGWPRLTIPDGMRRLARPDGWRWLTSSAAWRQLRLPDSWRRSAPANGWMRPVFATAGAVIVAIMAIMAIPQLRQGVIATFSAGSSTSSNPSSPGNPVGVVPSGTGQGPLLPSTSPASTSTPTKSSTPTPTPTC